MCFVSRVKGYRTPDKQHEVASSEMAVQSLERTGEVNVSLSTTPKGDTGLAGDSAGDTINYTILLNNTGTTTLRNITVTSPQLLAQFERYVLNVLTPTVGDSAARTRRGMHSTA